MKIENAPKINSDVNNRILLVEDNEQFRTVLGFKLTLASYDVVQASDGKEALEKILYSLDRGHPFDLLVTDIVMPGLSGLDLIHSLQEHNVDIPTIIMTGDLYDGLLDELLNRNVLGVLEKPFNFSKLKELIKCILGEGPFRRPTCLSENTNITSY